MELKCKINMGSISIGDSICFWEAYEFGRNRKGLLSLLLQVSSFLNASISVLVKCNMIE